jgi:hypothetical protein
MNMQLTGLSFNGINFLKEICDEMGDIYDKAFPDNFLDEDNAGDALNQMMTCRNNIVAFLNSIERNNSDD